VRRKILFVDDDPNVLEGMRRTFRALRREWALAFARSGIEAMEILSRVRFDVVVSDIQVAGMDGAMLLTEVMKKHPDVVRIVLSGDSGKEAVMKVAHPAHQYLSKPYNSDRLRKLLERACSLRDRMADDGLKNVVSNTDSLPSMPALYASLLEELGSEDASIQRVGDIISSDVAMTAKILKLVNSVMFGCRSRVSSIAQAVGIIGLETIRGLVLSVQIFSQFEGKDFGEFSLQILWDHSMKTGSFAREIAKAEKADRHLAGDAFMAGMVHDSGKLILVSNFTKRYGKVLSRVAEDGVSVCDAELEVFGTTHEDIGAYLMTLWGLPDSIVEAIAYHHHTSDCRYRAFSPLTLVHAANVISTTCEEDETLDEGPAAELDMEYLKELGLEDREAVWRDRCSALLEKV